MKKIFLLLTLAMISVTSWAAVNITVSPNNVDFGTVSIKGKTNVEDSVTINVTYSGLQPYCGVVLKTTRCRKRMLHSGSAVRTQTNGFTAVMNGALRKDKGCSCITTLKKPAPIPDESVSTVFRMHTGKSKLRTSI